MRRASIFISVSIFSLLLLLLIYHTPTQHLRHRHHRLRLRLRSNFTFSPPFRRQQHDHYNTPFDPLIADIHLRREDPAPAAESHPDWEEFIDDDARFNVTERLVYLFPKIDVDPHDGFVSAEELAQWNFQLAMDEALHRTEMEFQSHDENRDGFVSFAEYEPPSWVMAAGNGSFGHDLGWWNEEHFNASDANGDGVLDMTEYNDFLHPADSKSPKLLLWLCADVVREKDADKDGKLNFSEFFHGIFDLLRKNDENYHLSTRDDSATEALAKKIFSDLDKNYDGYLSATELLPVIGKIHLSEAYFAKQQAEYIISQVESDDDGLLTLNDMIENPLVFYSAVFSEDEMDYYPYHDEFR